MMSVNREKQAAREAAQRAAWERRVERAKQRQEQARQRMWDAWWRLEKALRDYLDFQGEVDGLRERARASADAARCEVDEAGWEPRTGEAEHGVVMARNALVQNGLVTREQVAHTPDDDLLRLRGFGVGALRITRRRIPFEGKD